MQLNKFLVGMAVGALAFSACGKDTEDPVATPDAGVTKVGFLYVGPIGDYGWSKSADDGRNYVENFATNVKTTYRESVSPADAPAVIDEMVADGNSIIFATSFDFLDAALGVNQRHPDVWTLNCSGFKTAPRTGNYQARIEQTEYLSGMVAGEMAKRSGTNKIGVVGALWIYEQMMHINAFALGAKSVNPAVQIKVRWVGNWFNPEMESKAVTDLVAEGCDVIKTFTDTSIPLQTAVGKTTPDGKPVRTVAHGNKAACTGVDNCLVTSYYNWGPLLVRIIDEIRAGDYPESGRIDYLGLEDLDIVGLEWPANDIVPQEVKSAVAAKQEQIAARQFNVYQGPYNDSAGTAWKAAGETMSDEELICTSKFVEGITVLDGPTCVKDADCKTPDLPASIACVDGVCKAMDLSGCSSK